MWIIRLKNVTAKLLLSHDSFLFSAIESKPTWQNSAKTETDMPSGEYTAIKDLRAAWLYYIYIWLRRLFYL